MTDSMKKFLEEVSSSKELAERIGNMDRDEVIRTAENLGITLTDADFSQPESGDMLSDDELTSVAGGGKCGCVWAGGGNAGDGHRKCKCYKNGSGEFVDGCKRCSCTGLGGGVDK